MADNLAIVQRAYEAFLQGDIRQVVDLLDPDIVWSVPRTVPHGGDFRGLSGVREFFCNVGAAWRPLDIELHTVGEIGPGLVAATATVSGTLAESEVSYGAVHVFTLVDGTITRFQEYLDLDAALPG